jgi:Protein of unknown function (DUF4089)
MSETRDAALDCFVAAAAAALELPLQAEWKPAIKAHLHVIWGLAALVAEFDLPDELEPAPVFET